MEVRTDVEREKLDVRSTIAQAMGAVPVVITVIGTSEMPGKSSYVDVCCVVEVPDKIKFQTATKTTNEPVWDEGVQLNDFVYSDTIKFIVYDNIRDEVFGRATLQGSEVYLDGYDGEVKLSDTEQSANIFVRVKVARLAAIGVHNQPEFQKRLKDERENRILGQLELRNEVMACLQDERNDRSEMCSA